MNSASYATSYIHHVGLTVSNLNASVDFYTSMLGCNIVSQQEKSGGYLSAIVGYPDAHVKMCHLRAPVGDVIIELFQYLAPAATKVELEPRLIGNPHICFAVPDLSSIHEELRDSGVRFISAPIPIDTGVNAGGKGLYLRDPDDVIIELFELPK